MQARANRRKTKQWAQQGPNYPGFLLGIVGVRSKAARNPARTAVIRPLPRPRRRPPILSWRRWSRHGPTCPRRSGRAWWRWSGLPRSRPKSRPEAHPVYWPLFFDNTKGGK